MTPRKPAPEPGNGVRRAHSWLALVATGIAVAAGIGGAAWGVLTLAGDARWVPSPQYAHACERHDAAHAKLDGRLMAVEKDVAVISSVLGDQRVALDRQAAAVERVLERIDRRESRPLAPAPRR